MSVSLIEEGNPGAGHSMDERWGRDAQWNEPATKRHILCDSSCMWCLEESHSQRQKVERGSPGLGGWVSGSSCFMWTEFPFCRWRAVMVAQECKCTYCNWTELVKTINCVLHVLAQFKIIFKITTKLHQRLKNKAPKASQGCPESVTGRLGFEGWMRAICISGCLCPSPPLRVPDAPSSGLSQEPASLRYKNHGRK